MQVGDLVRHKNHPLTGIVLEIRASHFRCLWDDGDDCWVVEWWVMPVHWATFKRRLKKYQKNT